MFFLCFLTFFLFVRGDDTFLFRKLLGSDEITGEDSSPVYSSTSFDVLNSPGAKKRSMLTSVEIKSENYLLLYGGYSDSKKKVDSDLWLYSPTQNMYKMLRGDGLGDVTHFEGKYYEFHQKNFPNGRQDGAVVHHKFRDVVYIFFGRGDLDKEYSSRFLSSLWMYSLTYNMFSLANKPNQTIPIYEGEKLDIHPGARSGHCGEFFFDDQIVLFGGTGFSGDGMQVGDKNDVFFYSTHLHTYTFVIGDQGVDSSGILINEGEYYHLNVPPSRRSFLSWKITEDSLMIYGGDSRGQYDSARLSDMWIFNTSMSMWKAQRSKKDVVLTSCITDAYDAANHPGARSESSGWVIDDDRVLIYSGQLASVVVPTQDLWVYSRERNQFRCIFSHGEEEYEDERILDDGYGRNKNEYVDVPGSYSNTAFVTAASGMYFFGGYQYHSLFMFHSDRLWEVKQFSTCLDGINGEREQCNFKGVCQNDECKCDFMYHGRTCARSYAVGVFVPLGIILGTCCLAVIIVVVFLWVVRRRRKKRGKDGRIRLKDVKAKCLDVMFENDENFLAHLQINRDDHFQIKIKDLKYLERISSSGNVGKIILVEYNESNYALKYFGLKKKESQWKINQIEKELEKMKRIRNPFCVQYFGSILFPPRFGILMEHCELGNAKTFLTNYRIINKVQYPFVEKMISLHCISRALSHLHEDLDIIHRDLKLSSVIFTRKTMDIEPRVDFGLPSGLLDETHDSRKSGTVFFQAPEVTLGMDPSKSIDVYSFSIFMFVFLTENFQHPFGDVKTRGIEFKVANQNLRPVMDDLRNETMKKLIATNWDPEVQKRMTMRAISKFLKKELCKLLELAKERVVAAEAAAMYSNEETLKESLLGKQ